MTASSGSVDTAVIWQYLLDYTYTDTHSNSWNTVTRTVNVVSWDTPVITLNGSGSITQEVWNFYFDAGAEYVDTEDWTNPIVGSGSFDAFTVWIYVLTYDYTDTHWNIATQVTRTVHIEDTTEPVVVLNWSTSESIFLDSTFIDVWAHWTDNYDWTWSIVSANSWSVDTSILWQYLLDYTYTDTHSNSGNTVTRTVNVVSWDTPIITINGNWTITQEVWSWYIDLWAEYSDTEDWTGALIASWTVDGYTVWEYILTYDFDDSQGNSAIQVIRTVNIVDTT